MEASDVGAVFELVNQIEPSCKAQWRTLAQTWHNRDLKNLTKFGLLRKIRVAKQVEAIMEDKKGNETARVDQVDRMLEYFARFVMSEWTKIQNPLSAAAGPADPPLHVEPPQTSYHHEDTEATGTTVHDPATYSAMISQQSAQQQQQRALEQQRAMEQQQRAVEHQKYIDALVVQQQQQAAQQQRQLQLGQSGHSLYPPNPVDPSSAAGYPPRTASSILTPPLHSSLALVAPLRPSVPASAPPMSTGSTGSMTQYMATQATYHQQKDWFWDDNGQWRRYDQQVIDDINRQARGGSTQFEVTIRSRRYYIDLLQKRQQDVYDNKKWRHITDDSSEPPRKRSHPVPQQQPQSFFGSKQTSGYTTTSGGYGAAYAAAPTTVFRQPAPTGWPQAGGGLSTGMSAAFSTGGGGPPKKKSPYPKSKQ
eukprot:TRINITY_DN9835_c0_g1_i1.p1 TRINITY_DN9835_c0_g1~~TRINITY_DN9835_c0_g1_i1.p1  ORF type:complete len:438 (-),score=85.49 TRINITY_DN9835_c0_g1_i1:12-1274(-)